MQFNINTFRANGLIESGARPSLFEVTFPIVGTINQLVPITATSQTSREKLTFLCTSASLPAFNVEAIPVYYFGRPVYYAGERSFSPWVITVLNDEDFELRDFFEAWSNKMNSIVGNVAETSNPANYKVDNVIAHQYGKAGDLLRAYEFFGMWPSVVGDIALAWDQGNRIETFDVRLVYDFAQPAPADATDREQLYPGSFDTGLSQS